MRYRTYDPRGKQMIINSGNPTLLPELGIPRTTASYWIKKSKSIPGRSVGVTASIEVETLKRENFKLKAKKLFLSELVSSGFGFELSNSLKGKARREKIVKLIESFKGILNLPEMLTSLGISFSTYYRYRSEISGCHFTQLKCGSSFGRALSQSDQATMIALAIDKRYAHFSTKSLSYFAQRHGLLTCGIDSWYKYLKMNQVIRPRLVAEKRKCYGQGIRATKPNELWHIDITEVKTQSFQKLYLQLIVDNFSRSIISFKTGYRKNLKLSLKTLKCLDDSRILRPDYVFTDGGKENVNSSVAKILVGKGITHLVANSDVNFSNSIVEAVFRQMKRIPEIRNPRSLNMFQKAIQKYART